MVPFKFVGLRVGHNSAFKVHIVSLLISVLNVKSENWKNFKILTLISDGFRVLPSVNTSLGLSTLKQLSQHLGNNYLIYLHITKMSQWSSIVLPGMFLL